MVPLMMADFGVAHQTTKVNGYGRLKFGDKFQSISPGLNQIELSCQNTGVVGTLSSLTFLKMFLEYRLSLPGPVRLKDLSGRGPHSIMARPLLVKTPFYPVESSLPRFRHSAFDREAAEMDGLPLFMHDLVGSKKREFGCCEPSLRMTYQSITVITKNSVAHQSLQRDRHLEPFKNRMINRIVWLRSHKRSTQACGD